MMWRITVFLLLWANLAFADFPQHVHNALAQTFSVNQLNQLGSVTRNTTFTLTGALPGPANSVTVNGGTAQVYGDFTFANTNNTTLANGNNTFTVVAENVYSTSVTNTLVVNLPSSNSFTYDNNGNLTNDGTRTFAYDAENRLTNVTVTGQYQTVYVYDGLSRLRKMTNSAWESGAWTSTNVTYYVYDGMTVLQERNASSTPEVTYTRGLDLSASLNGAGGIGGLLSRTDGNGTTFYHSDGSGNITALTDTNANIVARCEYDPYGKMLALTGPMASVNHYWFSSKEMTAGSGLYNFGFRFYEPNFSRFLNRDPLQEAGGVNLYTFAGNNPASRSDPYGLSWIVEQLPPGFIGPPNTYYIDDGLGNGVWPNYAIYDEAVNPHSTETMADFAFLLPEIPALSKALGWLGEKLGLKTPQPKIPCSTKPLPPGWTSDWEKGISSRSNTGKPGGEKLVESERRRVALSRRGSLASRPPLGL